MKTTKKPYEAPTLTVVSFRIEKGFQNSQGQGINAHSNNDDNEALTESSDWHSGSNRFWD